ncbi:MAG: hypothetical protein HRU41_39030 [Saprospiraceae bacterium]|nr:hypothetical protein [Saprospiraceae bacterium]
MQINLPKPFLFTFAAVALLFTIFGFNTNKSETKELMTLVVSYQNRVQFLVESHADGTCKREVFIAKNARQRFKQQYKTPGVTYEELPLQGRYDNTAILARVQSLTKQGWRLVSHDYSMAIGDPIDEPWNKERVSFYLFER